MMKKILKTFILLFFLVFSFLFISPVMKESRSSFHSSQLKKKVTMDDNIERTDYVDKDGRIAIAADLGFATVISKKNNNTKTYYYYDEKGEPISRYSGYFALQREYDEDGNNITVYYLDIKGNPVVTANGYAIEKREYNEYGQITRINYFDANGVPIVTSSYGNGKINEYDSNGNICRIIYIDTVGNPVMTNQGYAIVNRNYYISDGIENGRVESEFYLNEQGLPVALSLGQYGVHKEYNSIGQETVLTYLDENGAPTVTNKGYTTVVRTYHSNNTVATERYFDLKGNPFALSEGQFGIDKENGQTNYLNIEGKKTINLKNVLYNHSWLIIVLSLIVLLISNLISRKGNVILLILAIGAILYLTLLFRENIGNKSIDFFKSYNLFFIDAERRANVLKNIWLFIPLGMVLFRLCPQKSILLIPILLSALIEVIQYYTSTGFCELDDIISNGLGGAIGYGMGCQAKMIHDLLFCKSQKRLRATKD